MIGRLPTGRFSGHSSVRYAVVASVIRIARFSGAQSRPLSVDRRRSFPPMIRRPSDLWKLWARKPPVCRSCFFRTAPNCWRALPTDVAQKVGLRTRAQTNFYDLAIVGGGPAGSGGGGLWRVRRPAHGDDRARSSRRPGWDEFAHRELSRISRGPQRRRSRPARGRAGAAFWSRDSVAARSGRRAHRRSVSHHQAGRRQRNFLPCA